MTKNHNQSKTPYLDRFTMDLGEKLRPDAEDFVAYGRDQEIRDVAISLLRLNKNSPVLVGEAGVGKTRIVEGFAVACLRKDVPREFHNIKIRVLELSSIQATTINSQGEKEDMLVKMKHIVNELVAHKSENILFIDEVHTVMGTGAVDSSTLDVANLLKPALSRGEIYFISATTYDEFREIEKDPAMERRLQPIYVDEPSPTDTVKILERLKGRYERERRITILPEALIAAVDYSVRYMADKRLPDKAIDLIDEAVSVAYLDGMANVAATDIAKVVSAKKQIPLDILEKMRAGSPVDVALELKRVIKGQDHAIDVIAKRSYMGQVGLQNKNRPILSGMLLGTSGVGKTEICRQLADILYGSEDNFTRLDCSEYMNKDAISRLIGDEETGNGGFLTEVVKRRPYQLILVDESEKGNDDVKNLFLQILDAGRLTDSRGRLVDFKNTAIIFTSNSGHQAIKSKYQISGNFSRLTSSERQAFNNEVMREVKKDFKAELLNRFNFIVIMNMLDHQVASEIVELKLGRLERELLDNYGVSITYQNRGDFCDYLESIGVDADNGARPLERALEEALTLPIAEQLYFMDRESGERIEALVSLEGHAPGTRVVSEGRYSARERRQVIVKLKK